MAKFSNCIKLHHASLCFSPSHKILIKCIEFCSDCHGIFKGGEKFKTKQYCAVACVLLLE